MMFLFYFVCSKPAPPAVDAAGGGDNEEDA